MILFNNFLLFFMVLLGFSILNMPILTAATNLPNINIDDGGSTLITTTKTPDPTRWPNPSGDPLLSSYSYSAIEPTSTVSTPTATLTFHFDCPNEGCADVYNKCMQPDNRKDHRFCMFLTCETYKHMVCLLRIYRD